VAVRKVNGRWLVEFQAHGKRVFKRLPEFATKSDAAQLEAKLRRERWEYSELGRAEEPTLAEAIIGWLRATEAGRKDKLNPARNAAHLAPFVEGKALREVGEVAGKVIDQWSDVRSSSARIRVVDAHSLSKATINRRLDVLRAAARWAWKQGMIADNLAGRVPRLREENARQVYLTPTQIRSLAGAAPNRQSQCSIMIAAYTGLRASELLALQRTPMRAATLTVTVSKTGKPRLVPIAGPLRPFLSALPLGCSYRLLIKWFHAARKKAGMPHVHFHDLRHSCASMLINSGVDLYTVGKILGHSSPQTTARYAHLSDASLQKAMGKLR
jgi:integrase